MKILERQNDNIFRFFGLVTLQVPSGDWTLEPQELNEQLICVWLNNPTSQKVIGSIQVCLANNDPTEPDINSLEPQEVEALDQAMEKAIRKQMTLIRYMGSKLNKKDGTKTLVTAYITDEDGDETQFIAIRTSVGDQKLVMLGTFLVDHAQQLAQPVFNALQGAILESSAELAYPKPEASSAISSKNVEECDDPVLHDQLNQLESWYKQSAYDLGKLPSALFGTNIERKQFKLILENADIDRTDKFDFIRYVLKKEACEYYQYGSLCGVLDEDTGSVREELALVAGSREQALTSNWRIDRVTTVNPNLIFTSRNLVTQPSEALTTSFLSDLGSFEPETEKKFEALWLRLSPNVERSVLKDQVSTGELFAKPLTYSDYWTLDTQETNVTDGSMVDPTQRTSTPGNTNQGENTRWGPQSDHNKSGPIMRTFWVAMLLILVAFVFTQIK